MYEVTRDNSVEFLGEVVQSSQDKEWLPVA
jgi:hypothetical protein